MAAIKGSLLIFSLSTVGCSSILKDSDQDKKSATTNSKENVVNPPCSNSLEAVENKLLNLDSIPYVYSVDRDLSLKIKISPELKIKDLNNYVVKFQETLYDKQLQGCINPYGRTMIYYGKGLSSSTDAHIQSQKDKEDFSELPMSIDKTGEFVTGISFSIKEKLEEIDKSRMTQTFQIMKMGFDYNQEFSKKAEGLEHDALGLLTGTNEYAFDQKSFKDVQSIEIELKDSLSLSP